MGVVVRKQKGYDFQNITMRLLKEHTLISLSFAVYSIMKNQNIYSTAVEIFFIDKAFCGYR